jgi:PEP-CTERM motif
MYRRLCIMGGMIALVAFVGAASACSILEPTMPEAPPQGEAMSPGDYSHFLPGDANGDGWVTDGDYAIWADNYGATDATWAQGDFNGDGVVSDGDYTVWADHYGWGMVSQQVPEPLTAFAALAGVGAIARYMRRRKNL